MTLFFGSQCIEMSKYNYTSLVVPYKYPYISTYNYYGAKWSTFDLHVLVEMLHYCKLVLLQLSL